MGVRERAAVLIVEDGRVLLMRRRKHGSEYYVVPGGGIESGETPEEAAIREAKEEAGLDVAPAKKLGAFRHEGRMTHYFLAASRRGQSRIGSPERERRSAGNVYELEWVDAARIGDIPLRPPHARRVCRGVLKTS